MTSTFRLPVVRVVRENKRETGVLRLEGGVLNFYIDQGGPRELHHQELSDHDLGRVAVELEVRATYKDQIEEVRGTRQHVSFFVLDSPELGEERCNMKATIELNCGEETCATKPGEFCRHVRTRRFGTEFVCGLFPSGDDTYTPLTETKPGGWLKRCSACLEATTQKEDVVDSKAR